MEVLGKKGGSRPVWSAIRACRKLLKPSSEMGALSFSKSTKAVVTCVDTGLQLEPLAALHLSHAATLRAAALCLRGTGSPQLLCPHLHGPNWPTVFINKFTGTQRHPFVSILPMAAFSLQQKY